MNAIVDIIVAKLKEPSTWHGLNIIVAAFGLNVAPELWQGIASVAMSVAGVVEVVRKEAPAQ